MNIHKRTFLSYQCELRLHHSTGMANNLINGVFLLVDSCCKELLPYEEQNAVNEDDIKPGEVKSYNDEERELIEVSSVFYIKRLFDHKYITS